MMFNELLLHKVPGHSKPVVKLFQASLVMTYQMKGLSWAKVLGCVYTFGSDPL